MLLPANDTNKPFWPARWWWIALGLLLFVAGAFRFIGYNFSLPYVDTPSEANFALAGLATLTRGSARAAAMYGYPPGLIMIYYFLIRFFGSTDVTPLVMLGPVRLISIVVSLASIVMIALLGYRASTPLAGLLAAGLWTVAPTAIGFSRFARPDYYVVFFCLLALFLSVSGAIYDRDKLATWGIVALLFGILFKYSAIAVTPAVLLPPLVRWFGSTPDNKRRVLANFGSNVLILAVFGFWLYALTPAVEASNIPNYSGSISHVQVPGLSTLGVNLARSVGDVGFGVSWIPGALGLIVLAWPRFRATVSTIGLGSVAGAAALWTAGVSLYGAEDFRQLILLSALLAILLGVGLGLLAEGLVWAAARVERPRLSISPRVSALAVSVALALISVPQALQSVSDAHNHTLSDRRVDLWQWGDVTLEPDSYYIGTSQTEKIFNPSYGGYTGTNEFQRFENSKISKQPLAYWRDNGVKYAILPYDEYVDLKESSDANSYLDQMVLLKSYPPSDSYRDPGLFVFSLFPIQHPLDAQLGSIKVVGYTLSSNAVRPGDSATLVLYWKALQPPPGDYKVFNHLVDARSNLVAQVDDLPLFDPRRPTSTWDDPTETIMSREFTLPIGPDMAPGDYTLITGFYREDTGQRLTGADGADHAQVVALHVTR